MLPPEKFEPALKDGTASAARPGGSRPEGTHDEREAAARVQQMFSRIAPRYDFLNHLLSFSLDRVRRYRTARRFLPVLRKSDARVLDLCCGTGDLAFALDRARAKAAGGSASERYPVIGSDFVQGMLERAREKSRGGGRAVVFATADALNLPFSDSSFDLVTTAFGFRNLANYERGLREFARVLKPGGELGILEFSEPGSGPFAGAYSASTFATFFRVSAARSQATARPTNTFRGRSRNFRHRRNSRRSWKKPASVTSRLRRGISEA